MATILVYSATYIICLTYFKPKDKKDLYYDKDFLFVSVS